MAFNSLSFLLLFPLAVAAFYAAPHRWRVSLLLLVSYGFYMRSHPAHAIILFGVTGITYVAALQGGAGDHRTNRRWLLISLICTLGTLAVFKYTDFALHSVSSVVVATGLRSPLRPLGVLLPLGISFFTFQALGYVIDVHRGTVAPERRFAVYALYVSYFPQLVAGPIERSRTLLPQLTETATWDRCRVADGLKRMLWGYFKKLVVADRLAVYVDAIYGDPTAHSGGTLLIATYMFAFQLYYDFSAYSDIAIGAARILSVDLMENFRRPFRARSIGEMWQRWHISLTTWFRDYLYMPLARRRTWRANPVLDFFPLFILIGVWHGPRWTFAIFGALHAIYFATGVLTARARSRARARLQTERWPRLHAAIQVVFTFHLMALSVVFFRAESLSEAVGALATLGNPSRWTNSSTAPFSTGRDIYELAIALTAILLVEGLDWAAEQDRGPRLLRMPPRSVRWTGYYALALAILMFGAFGTAQFIYFEF